MQQLDSRALAVGWQAYGTDRHPPEQIGVSYFHKAAKVIGAVVVVEEYRDIPIAVVAIIPTSPRAEQDDPPYPAWKGAVEVASESAQFRGYGRIRGALCWLAHGRGP